MPFTRKLKIVDGCGRSSDLLHYPSLPDVGTSGVSEDNLLGAYSYGDSSRFSPDSLLIHYLFYQVLEPKPGQM